MSEIFYYSNFCPFSKKILSGLAKSVQTKKDLHFICIDKRKNIDGRTYIDLENGQRVLLPPIIDKVPALYLIKEEGRTLYGDDIKEYFKPKQEYIQQKVTQNNGEPLAFSTSEMGLQMSDKYAYLDLTPNELSAKGDGGMRQLHHFSVLGKEYSIETPPDNYEPDTVGEVDMGKLQQKRANELKQTI